MEYPHFFSSANIGGASLKNRLVMSPMTMNYATEQGLATEKLIKYYLERAKGGVGLIMMEGTFFDPVGRGYMNQLGISSDAHVEQLKPLPEAVHGLNNQAKIFLQIHHAGWRCSSKLTGHQPVGPTALAPYPGGEVCRELTRDEIKQLVESHVLAAVRTKQAGFDGVDIHCAHGYLVPSFFSQLSNRRNDEYGGDIEGRTRFLREIVRGIKQELGRDFPLTIKISGDDFIKGGLVRDDVIQIALLAQDAGIDGITISAGSVGGEKIGDLAQAHQVLRTLPMMTQPGCLVPLAAEFKKSLKIPVTAVGRINTPALAEEIIASGKADLVAVGRPFLADPFFPAKIQDGREEDIRPCIACNEGCYKRIFQQADIRCSVNPRLGREAESVESKAESPKKILVVGGGPAGMEAALAAWNRGHAVWLAEKTDKLGGQLNLAAVPPGRQDIEKYRDFIIRQLAKSEVKILMGRELTPELVQEIKPDAMILATGALPGALNISGLDSVSHVTAWEVLAGEKDFAEPFVVLGGGLVGCETADYLAQQGKDVCLVEVLSELAAEADGDTKSYFSLRFADLKIKAFTGAKLLKVEPGKAYVQLGEEESALPLGTLVFAVGAKPNDESDQKLVDSGLSVTKVGDCSTPRRIIEAVKEGYLAGSSV